ncbi:TonB-dependent receptor plug domain-containing protein [Hydrogenophaga soli]
MRLTHPRLVASAFLLGLFPSVVLAEAGARVDLTQVPFEQLLDTDIVTAKKLVKQVSEAASAVSVVTADDIKALGYRSIHDILNSMRGIMMVRNNDGYSYLAGRGLGSKDYAGRVTMLIDGLRVSDNVFGQSYFGTDGVLDVELIERVEYIPGAGSAIHGNGAFLGVVNVITKKGKDVGGVQVSQEFGANHWNRTRLTYGKQFDNGLDLLLSGSTYRNSGRFATTYDGYPDRVDKERNQRLFVKGSFEGWGLEGSWSRHPSAMNLGEVQATDESAFWTLTHDRRLGPDLKLSAQASVGQYLFDQNSPGGTDFARGRWYGLDLKFVGTWFDRHTWVFGTEHRNDHEQRLRFEGAGYDMRTRHRTDAAYVYDNHDILDNLQLNYGLRVDHHDTGRQTLSPRMGLIYRPWEGAVLKLSSGKANRQPVPYESYGSVAWGVVPEGYVLPTEQVTLNELVWEQQLGPRTRLMASLFGYRTRDRSYVNWDLSQLVQQRIVSSGADVEWEHNWIDGRRLKVSYAWQTAKDDGGRQIPLSPHHLLKLNFSAPWMDDRVRWGVEAQAVSRRCVGLQSTDACIAVGGYSVTHLTLSSSRLVPGWEASVSVRNLFNRRYSDFITGEGRGVWLQLGRDFK